MAEPDQNLKLELYKMVAQTRNMEIGLFWQRSNYFLVLNTAIAVGFFNEANKSYQLLLSIAGIFVASLWVLVNLGSKFWQMRWDYRLQKTENNVADKLDLFSASSETIQRDVELAFGSRERGWFYDQFKKGVMLRPSVTLMMTVLSVAFVVFWVVATAIALAQKGQAAA